jgi:hypothetical protein
MKRYSYDILQEKELIIKYYHGKMDLADLYRFMNTTSENPAYSPTFNVLNDLRDCEILFSVKDIYEFVDNVRQNKYTYNKRNVVFLTNTPGQVTFGLLVDAFKNESLINLMTCSTLDHALRFLKIEMTDWALIEEMLSRLKKDLK